MVLGRRLRDGRRVDAARSRPSPGPDIACWSCCRAAGGSTPARRRPRSAARRGGPSRRPPRDRVRAGDRAHGRVGGVWLAVIVLSLLAVGTAVALALVQARRLAAPIERLAARAGRVAEPGVRVDAHPTGIAEVDRIGAALAAADRQVRSVAPGARVLRQRLASAADTADGPADAPRGARALAPTETAVAEADAALAQADRLMDTIEHLETLARGPAPAGAGADLARVVAEQSRPSGHRGSPPPAAG